MTVKAPHAALEDLVRRAVDVAAVPMGWISFINGERERLEARVGVPFSELAAERSFAFAGVDAPRFVEDAAQSEWRSHPLVTAEPRARFVGVLPLVARDGHVFGTLTVLDPRPRALQKSERTALANLASLAVARVEATQVPRAQRLEDEVRRRETLEEQLAQEKAFTEAVLENLSGAFILMAPDGRLLRWNGLLATAVSYSDERIGRMQALDFISEHDRTHVAEAMRAVFEEGRDVSVEAEIVDGRGNVRPYALNGRPVMLGGRRLMLAMARDITLRKRAEQQMAQAKERLDLALASSSLALWDWDLRTNKVYFNESWASLMGDAPRESIFSADEVQEWNHPEDRELFRAALSNAARGVSSHFDCEYRVSNAAGEWLWVHSRGKVTQRDPQGMALRMTGTSTNITKRKHAEERAEHLATRDALTGLPNRILLHDRLEQAVVNAARNHAGFAFMFIDLDRFKNINDSLGHHAGDQLLKAVASRLTACVRASDTVARLGGDEFAVILENLRDEAAAEETPERGPPEGAHQVAEKMIGAMASPMMIDGQPLATSCSIGISLYPGDARDSATLMKNADVAMYYAKEKGRNNYQFFSSEMNARAQERLSIESYLRLAIKRNELVLHYQPRMTLSGELVGVEALVRWQHPRRGLLAPARFIDIAEDSGLIVPIGEWVIRTACNQIALWQKRVKPGLSVSVNLSVGQLQDGERLLRAVSDALYHACLDSACLELEVTESHLMRDIDEKASILQRLGDLGVGIAIDDFGTGYSSLSYLKKLPVDTIKIDGSFVRDIEADPNDEAIIRAILAMAHSLKLSVVAEGVETAAQFEALRALGCDEYQGFLESPALPAAEFERRYAAG